ncbi:MAG: hypothetical protein KDA55_11600, partial [Planctomycetales bacterium]|nr:hypothetical protein [Planctomycetales bacterium]
ASLTVARGIQQRANGPASKQSGTTVSDLVGLTNPVDDTRRPHSSRASHPNGTASPQPRKIDSQTY